MSWVYERLLAASTAADRLARSKPVVWVGEVGIWVSEGQKGRTGITGDTVQLGFMVQYNWNHFLKLMAVPPPADLKWLFTASLS